MIAKTIAKTIAGALLAALSTLAALPAAASQIVDLRYAGANMTRQSSLSLPLGVNNYLVGSLRFETRNPNESFIGYCADPFQWASGSYHEYAVTALADAAVNAVRYASVSRLFGHAYAATLTNATKAAGFQLALWEVFNDDGFLNSGSVKTTANSNASIVTEAQNLLNALSSWTDVGTAYDLQFYTNGNYQDYIVVAGVIPEPGQYALLLAGLGLLGYWNRRRNA